MNNNQSAQSNSIKLILNKFRNKILDLGKYTWSRITAASLLSVFITLIILLPLIAILFNSGSVTASKWSDLLSNSIPGLLANTLKLAIIVAFLTSIIGVSAAWLVTRYRFIGSKVVVWLLILPLAIPTYVYADIYTRLFSYDGWLGSIGIFWNSIFVSSSEFSTLIATSIVLSLASFPYVFLLVRTSLNKSTKSLEDVARLHGLSSFQRFWRVNFPLLRPALAASLAIVILHTISDFGAVSVMQFPTFTWEIYIKSSHAKADNDYGPAAALSIVLIVLAFTFLILERFFRSRQRYYADDIKNGEHLKKKLSKLQLFSVWFWIGLILVFSVGLPLFWLLVKSWASIQQNYINSEFWQYTFNSFWIAFVVASIAIMTALPIALFNYRRQSRLSQLCIHGSNVGFILPGPVVIIGTLLVFALFVSEFGSLAFVAAWIAAVIIRYMPFAVQAEESALQQITPSIEQAGRLLGLNAWQNLKRVLFPIMRQGLAGAWVLVFIDALKELPIALIINEPGMMTLPIKIWLEADDETLELAAPAALMLVFVTLPALWLIMRDKK